MKKQLQLHEIEKKLKQLKKLNKQDNSSPNEDEPYSFNAEEESDKPKFEPISDSYQPFSSDDEPVLQPSSYGAVKNELNEGEPAKYKPASYQPPQPPSYEPPKYEPRKFEPKESIDQPFEQELKNNQVVNEKQKPRRFPFFSAKDKKTIEPQPSVIEEKTPNELKPKEAPVQIVHRDRGVALSKHLEGIKANLDTLSSRQTEQATKSEIGAAQNGLEFSHINFLSRNVGRLNPVVCLNILYEVAYRFRDGSCRAADFARLSDKTMESYADCFSLLNLDERVKLKPKKKQLIKKTALLLNKWNASNDKKILDEIFALRIESGTPNADFNAIAANYAKGKDITDDLKDFCSYKLSDIAEPPVLKDKPFSAPSVCDFLNDIHQEAIETRYGLMHDLSILQLQQAKPDALTDFSPILEEIKLIKTSLEASVRAQLKEEFKLVYAQLKALKDDLKTLKDAAKNGDKAKSKPKAAKVLHEGPVEEPTYNELLVEIAQLKSELQSEIQTLNLDKE